MQEMQEIQDTGSVSGSRRSPIGGNGTLFQHSCLEIPMDEKSGGLQSVHVVTRNEI